MQAYRVKQWAEVHETHESRKYQRLNWCAMPVKHDGLGFRHMVRQSDRNDLIAGWYMILQVVAKGPIPTRRGGWLVRDGNPLTALDLSLMTGLTESTFKRCFEFFIQAPSDWIELADFPAAPVPPAVVPGDSPAAPVPPAVTPSADNSTVQNSTVGTKRERRGQATSAEIAASRTQAGALIAQIKAAEARGGELSGEERMTLRKNRATLARLQQKQAQGDFAPEPVSPNV